MEEILRQEIMLNLKANGLPVTGEFWLMLTFRTESELREIASEMKLRFSKPADFPTAHESVTVVT